MAVLDFPSSPTVGQQYAGSNGATYQWDGECWNVGAGILAAGDVGKVYGVNPGPAAAWTNTLQVNEFYWRSDTQTSQYAYPGLYVDRARGFTTNDVPQITFRRTANTLAAPMAIGSGTKIGAIAFAGASGNAWPVIDFNATPNGINASIEAIATNDFNASARGTNLALYATAFGTNAATKQLECTGTDVQTWATLYSRAARQVACSAALTSDTTLGAGEIYNFSTSGGARVATLPTVTGSIAGRVYRIRNIQGTNPVTINPSGGQTIDGQASYSLTGANAIITLLAVATTGSAWSVLSPSTVAAGDLTGTFPAPTVAKLNGALLGTTTPLARGDLLIANATPALVRVAKGTTGQVLSATATDAVWQSLTQSQFPVAPSGLLTANINDAQITAAKLATDAKPWTRTGTTIAPTTAGDVVSIPGITSGDGQLTSIIGGSETFKARLLSPTGPSGYTALTQNIRINAAGTAWLFDDNTKPSWYMAIGNADMAMFGRGAANVQPTNLFTLNNTGEMILPTVPPAGGLNEITMGGGTGGKARLIIYPNEIDISQNANAANVRDDTGVGQSWLGINQANGLQYYYGTTTPAIMFRVSPAGDINAYGIPGQGTGQYIHLLTTGGGLGGKVRLIEYYGGSTWLTNNADGASVRDDTASPQYWIGMDGAGLQYLYGTTSTQQMMSVSNVGNLVILGATAQKASGTTWSNPSDVRLKREISDYTTGLDAIIQLRPISFKFNGKAGMRDDNQLCYGLVADEVQSVMPEMVGKQQVKFNPDDTEKTEILSLDTSNVTLALVNAIKELRVRVIALEGRA